MDIKIIGEIRDYLEKGFEGLKPALAACISAACYLMFPDKTLMVALSMVLGASFLDIVTKQMALSHKNGGYLNAVKTGKLSSKTMWEGTRTKIFSYLIVAILTGMSYRVIYLQQIGIVLASFVYTIMFLREFESNIENLCEAGSDLRWLLLFARKKEKAAMAYYDTKETKKSEGVDCDRRI